MRKIGNFIGRTFVAGCRQQKRNTSRRNTQSRYCQEIKPFMSPLEEQMDFVGGKLALVQNTIEASFLPPGWYDALQELEDDKKSLH